jgi:predicted RNase H-like HicB family nuclease
MSPLLTDRTDSGPASYSPSTEPAGDSHVEAETIVVPGELFKRYIDVALRQATPRQIASPQPWFADLRGFRGVWGQGISPKECLDNLEEVLREWVILKLADRDPDLPVADGIDLRVVCRR